MRKMSRSGKASSILGLTLREMMKGLKEATSIQMIPLSPDKIFKGKMILERLKDRIPK